MAYDVREIGNAILDIADQRGIALSNLSFNKIIYFAHAWYLAAESCSLVDSPFEAWRFGPVHPQIYQQMKRFGDKPINGRLTRIDVDTGRDVPFEVCLDQDIMAHVRTITEFYGFRSASWLVNASHEPGAPWDQIWSAAESEPDPGMIIPDAVTREYFAQKLRRLD
jgi:uncharacterized phage-associated protein